MRSAVGEQQRGPGDLFRRGPAAQRYLGLDEVPDVRVAVDSVIERHPERPGASAFTVMPVPASSTARLRVSWTTAPLLAAQPVRPAPPTRPRALARVRMRPYPAARMGRAAARQASQVPTTLTSRQARRLSADSSSMVPRACTPARSRFINWPSTAGSSTQNRTCPAYGSASSSPVGESAPARRTALPTSPSATPSTTCRRAAHLPGTGTREPRPAGDALSPVRVHIVRLRRSMRTTSRQRP
jgi:hypothetical protein